MTLDDYDREKPALDFADPHPQPKCEAWQWLLGAANVNECPHPVVGVLHDQGRDWALCEKDMTYIKRRIEAFK